MNLPQFLLENPLQYCGLTEPLRLGRGQLLSVCETGALVFDPDARLHLLAARDAQTAAGLLRQIENPVFLMLCDGEYAHLCENLSFQHKMNCLQAVYIKKEPPETDGRLHIALPDDMQMETIIRNYHMDTPQELLRRRDRGELFFAVDENGRDAGFVGLHPEGCFGILKVMENMRGQGYGAALEAHIIRFCMETGRLPYCQVDVNNAVSLNLQKKMGLEFSPKPMLMLWNDFE